MRAQEEVPQCGVGKAEKAVVMRNGDDVHQQIVQSLNSWVSAEDFQVLIGRRAMATSNGCIGEKRKVRKRSWSSKVEGSQLLWFFTFSPFSTSNSIS